MADEQGQIRQRLFSKAQVATMLDVSPRTIDKLKDRGILAEPVDAGGPKWTERDIEDAIRNLEVERAARKLSTQNRAPDGINAHGAAKRKPPQNAG